MGERVSASGGGDRHLRDIRRILNRALVPIDRAMLEREVVAPGIEAAWLLATQWTEPR
ncbi:MAG: hypothetical protein ABJB74_14105 [Gemmatimonas sp.]